MYVIQHATDKTTYVKGKYTYTHDLQKAKIYKKLQHAEFDCGTGEHIIKINTKNNNIELQV